MKQNTLFVFLLLILLIGLVGCIEDDNSLIKDYDKRIFFENNLNWRTSELAKYKTNIQFMKFNLMEFEGIPINVSFDVLFRIWDTIPRHSKPLIRSLWGNLNWIVINLPPNLNGVFSCMG